jgi:hypothetical protein
MSLLVSEAVFQFNRILWLMALPVKAVSWIGNVPVGTTSPVAKIEASELTVPLKNFI